MVQAFTIPSGSMMDTLLVGDYILVNKFLYRFTAPERGDVIVFKYPNDESRDFIKRIIAVGGETSRIKDKRVYVNCKPVEPYVPADRRPVGQVGLPLRTCESTS